MVWIECTRSLALHWITLLLGYTSMGLTFRVTSLNAFQCHHSPFSLWTQSCCLISELMSNIILVILITSWTPTHKGRNLFVTHWVLFWLGLSFSNVCQMIVWVFSIPLCVFISLCISAPYHTMHSDSFSFESFHFSYTSLLLVIRIRWI